MDILESWTISTVSNLMFHHHYCVLFIRAVGGQENIMTKFIWSGLALT